MEERLYNLDEKLAPNEVRLIMGAPQSGRTSALCEIAREKVAAGANVLFVCTTEPGLRAVSEQLADAPGDSLCIATPQDAALRVLDTPEARDAFGRTPHILERYEEDILMDDMRVSQMKNKRLRSLSGYMFAGWSNLSDDRWEQTYEEDLFVERLHSNLRLTGGILACEAANLALKVLRAHDDVRAQQSYDWVIVDDFELASRASQHLLRALARVGFVAASASRPGAASMLEPYPCYEGARELVEAVPHTQVEIRDTSAQPVAIQNAIAGLATDAALTSLIPANADISSSDSVVQPAAVAKSAAEARADEAAQTGKTTESDANSQCDASGNSALSVHMEVSPEAEMQVIAQTAADALSRGESVLIIGGEKLWRRNIVKNFARVGLPISEPAKNGMRGRDLEDEKVASKLERAALARLRENSDDNLAWRTMLAVGDHVGRSAAINRVRLAVEDKMIGSAEGTESAGGSNAAATTPTRLREAMEQLISEGIDVPDIDCPLIDDLVNAYTRTKEALAAVPDSNDTASYSDSANRATAVKTAHTADALNSPAPIGPSILVCSLDDIAGRRADTVILGAFVNGVVPCREYLDPAGIVGAAKEREHTKDMRRVYGALQTARKQLVVSGFTAANLAVAETMDLHIASIKLRSGIRMAKIEPSEYLALLSPNDARN